MLVVFPIDISVGSRCIFCSTVAGLDRGAGEDAGASISMSSIDTLFVVLFAFTVLIMHESVSGSGLSCWLLDFAANSISLRCFFSNRSCFNCLL